MFTISYDAAKAYDSIQFWHLRKVLKSFGCPVSFCKYIINYLQFSTCCVLTAHGPSETFVPKRGIKQGDPLSPLLYILTIDSLHKNLRTVSRNENLGITWEAGGVTFRDASLGFADDTFVFGESVSSIYRIHQIVVQYFERHNLQLNIKKTNARYMVCTPEEPSLRDFDWKYQGDTLTWRDETEPFRYLGVHLRLDLHPESHLHEFEKSRLYPYYRRLYYGKLSLEQCVSAIREVVWPTLDFCSRFLHTTPEFVTKWDRMFIHVLKKKAKLCTPQVTFDGLVSVLNLLRYEHHYPKAVLPRLT